MNIKGHTQFAAVFFMRNFTNINLANIPYLQHTYAYFIFVVNDFNWKYSSANVGNRTNKGPSLKPLVADGIVPYFTPDEFHSPP